MKARQTKMAVTVHKFQRGKQCVRLGELFDGSRGGG
jgi:hypothetical protein